MLLFLRLNHHLWDMEMVQKVIRDKSSDADFDDVLMRSSVDITPNADMHTFIIMNNDH